MVLAFSAEKRCERLDGAEKLEFAREAQVVESTRFR